MNFKRKILLIVFSIFLLNWCLLNNKKNPPSFDTVSQVFIEKTSNKFLSYINDLSWDKYLYTQDLNIFANSDFVKWTVKLFLTWFSENNTYSWNYLNFDWIISWSIVVPMWKASDNIYLSWNINTVYTWDNVYFKSDYLKIKSINPKVSMLTAIFQNLIWKWIILDVNKESVNALINNFLSSNNKILWLISDLKTQKIFIMNWVTQENDFFKYEVEINKEFILDSIIKNYSSSWYSWQELNESFKNIIDKISFKGFIQTKDWNDSILYISWLRFADIFTITAKISNISWSITLNPSQNNDSKMVLDYNIIWDTINIDIKIFEKNTQVFNIKWTIKIEKSKDSYWAIIDLIVDYSTFSFQIKSKYYNQTVTNIQQKNPSDYINLSSVLINLWLIKDNLDNNSGSLVWTWEINNLFNK